MPELVLQIHDIDEAGKDYTFPLKKTWLDVQLADASLRGDPNQSEGTLHVHAQKNGPEYLVHGELQASLIAECCRCLGDAALPVRVSFATLFCRNVDKPPATLELTDDDLQREEFSGHQIPLDDLIREQLVLECPMQPLCKPDCTGIPVPAHLRPPGDVFSSAVSSDAQGNRVDRIDPRLAPLMRLRDKVPPNKE